MCSHFMVTSSGRNVLSSCRLGFLQHRAARELMKGLAPVLQGPVDARSDGVEFAAEKSGNFLILQFLKAAEKQDFSFFLRQLLERASQQFDFLLLLRGIRGKNRGQHVRLESGLRRKLAKVIDARVARNLVDPGAERGARAVALAVFQDTEEYRSEEHT